MIQQRSMKQHEAKQQRTATTTQHETMFVCLCSFIHSFSDSAVGVTKPPHSPQPAVHPHCPTVEVLYVTRSFTYTPH